MMNGKRKDVVVCFVFMVIAVACRKVNDDCNTNEYPNAPDRQWFVSFNGTNEEAHGHYILSCSDGGYLQIGETGDVKKNSKLLVIKVDENGSLRWSKEFSQGNHNLGNSALEIEDGYLICGAQDKNSSILKLDKSSGEIIWNQSFDNGGSDAFVHLALTEIGIVAVGYINAEDDQNTFYTQGEGYITFLSSAGVKIGGKALNLSHLYRIKQSQTNEYLIAGLTSGGNDYGLVKVDDLGNTIWRKTFGGSNLDHCFGMDISADGSVYLTGHTLSGTENWDTYTVKITPDGIKEWEAKRGNPRGFKPKYIHDEAWGVKATNDGGCLVVAGTGDEYGRYRRRCGNDGDNSNTWHVYLIKYSENGVVEWQKTYGGEKCVDWAGEDVALTPDGGAIVAVDNAQFGFLRIAPFQ